jgi:MFS family permease
MESFGIGIAEASSLMSIFSVAGLLLALPTGLLLGRFGPLALGVAASLATTLGSAMAAVAPDYTILLASRAVQGIGIALIGVTAPAVVAAVFPPERRGTPMGIWAMWMPVGGLIMYALAPSLALAAGWQAAFWLAAGVAGAGLVTWVVVLAAAGLRGPSGGPARTGAMARAFAELREGLGGLDIWKLVAVFALFATAMGATSTFQATFLVDVRGFDVTSAALVTALALVGTAVGSVAAGWVSDRIGSRRRVYVASLLVLGLTLALPFVVEGPLLALSLLLFGLVAGAVPSAIFASVPDAVPHPRLAGAGLAGIMLGQNLGFFLGPMLFAALLPSLGWVAGATLFGALVIVAAAIGWRVRVR